MKRVLALILAATFAFGGVASAQSGVDVKVRGVWDFTFGWSERSFVNSRRANDRGLDRNADNFVARHRIRTQINFIASENLQGVLMFEIGNLEWGRDAGNGTKTGKGAGGDLAADGVNIETKRAYLDWMVPDTGVSVRMGIQGLGLPSATNFVNPIFEDDVAAITVSYKIDDTFALTAFWARPFNRFLNDSGAGNRHLDDEMDMVGLILPVTLDGVEITPWFVYANVGSYSGFPQALYHTVAEPPMVQNERASAWWAGIAASVDVFDPLTFAFDVMYGDMHKMDMGAGFEPTGHYPRLSGTDEWGARGWFVDARIDYAFDFGTLGLFGWWSTGDSTEGINAGRFGRMAAGYNSAGFAPTTYGWDRGFGMGEDAFAVGYSGTGTWGVGIELADVSFIEDLSHTLRFAYYSGTSEKDVVRKFGNVPAFGFTPLYLVDDDNVYEINFDHTYKIYENLTACLELAYIHLDRSNVWKQVDDGGINGSKTDDAWKAQIHFQYKF